MQKKASRCDLANKILCMVAALMLLSLTSAEALFAYGGGGGGSGGGGGGNSDGSGAFGGSSGNSLGGLFESFTIEDLYRIFGWPIGASNPPKYVKPKPSLGSEEDLEKMYVNENFTKPAHWTPSMWKRYLEKRQAYRENHLNTANRNKRYHEKKYTAAVATSVAAAIAGTGVGIAAAGTGAATAVTTIAIAGDGIGAGAGALAEGKSGGQAIKAGFKKAVVSTIASKVNVGSNVGNGAVGFTVGIAYDNGPGTTTNIATPPDYVSPGDATRYSKVPDIHTIQK